MRTFEAVADNRRSGNARAAPLLFLLLFVGLTFTGGASRSDEFQLILCICLSAIVAGASLFCTDRGVLTENRVPLFFWGLCFLVIVAQLVPLPPALWSALPGRSFYLRGAELAQIDQPWRPLSLSPMRTQLSLLGLVPPLAVILAWSNLRSMRYRSSLQAVLLVMIFALATGAVQAAAKGSVLHFYNITNPGAAVGLFANRNHQALLLACCLPLLAVTPTLFAPRQKARMLASAAAPLLALPILLLIFVTGSRGGLVASVLGLIAFFILYDDPKIVRFRSRSVPLKLIATVMLASILAIAALGSGRSEAVRRLIDEGFSAQQRSDILGPGIRMAKEFFWSGAGSGTFVHVYQRFEPFEALKPQYLNQAHNELLQLVIEFGAVGCALLLLYLFWFLSRLRSAALGRPFDSLAPKLRLAGAAICIMTLVFSLHDYPLRTPLFASVFTLASLWLNTSGRRP